MSRLSEAKGIIECITLLERLQKEGFTAHLHLAGSIEPDARKHIEAAIKKHGEKIILHGFVSGAEKDSFFREIDFFLFPTRYHNETQGIVNLEAMSFGVPVIAFDRCCIGSDAEGGGGLAIPPTDDYVEAAAAFISDAMSTMREKRALARERFDYLLNHSSREIDELIGEL
ncbi:glycosyltransferase family 4 protein [Phenylobacterium sp.]|uniref:glycosyltransferase family 4 protein n=1 Tax=Phenylobacterium sp. TaxID=1871053 RepID=UPI0025F6AFBC|nr:glycosyltransferase family 4 protein [Phenylobacterium sp.]